MKEGEYMEKELKVHIETPISEVPPGLIVRSLFGMTTQELAQDILKHPEKWDCIMAG